jgi:hypothetical protein
MKTVCFTSKILNLKTRLLNNFHTFEPQQKNKTMASILLGNQIHTSGELPKWDN